MLQLAKLLAAVLPLIGKGVVNAWKQASANAQKEGIKSASIFGNKNPITLDEAQQILGINSRPMTLEKLHEHYEWMYLQNDRTKGGSFYLQGKIFRAKERVDEALANGEITLPRADDDISPVASSSEPGTKE